MWYKLLYKAIVILIIIAVLSMFLVVFFGIQTIINFIIWQNINYKPELYFLYIYIVCTSIIGTVFAIDLLFNSGK